MRDVAWILGALVLLAGLHACGETGEKITETLGETWDAVKDFGVEKRGEAEMFFEKNLDGLDEKLASAKKKAAALGEDAGKALDTSWSEALKKLEALKSAGEDGWEVARDEFVKAWEALKKKIGD